jgi:hypothetical protein
VACQKLLAAAEEFYIAFQFSSPIHSFRSVTPADLDLISPAHKNAWIYLHCGFSCGHISILYVMLINCSGTLH